MTPMGQTPDPAELIEAGKGDAEVAGSGSMRASLANAMVGLKAKYYGRGPDKAKAYIADNHVFVVMEGGLTQAEETMLADGKQGEVRAFRLSFEETMRDAATRAVAEITGRPVLAYHSQIVFDPPHALEWFVLSDEPEAADVDDD